MKALIDGDNLAFACAASAEDSTIGVACSRAATMIERVLNGAGADEAEIWLTGGKNFRFGLYPEYKANRKGNYRPKYEKDVKAYLTLDWKAQTTDGCEADDMIGVRQCELENTIACHLDKDINMIPGWHYNWELMRLGKVVREETKYFVTLEEANRFFYYQLLIGDPTDNIKGVYDIGAKKAEKLLSSCEPSEYKEKVRDCYSSNEEMEMNGGCLWIWRKPNDIWKLDHPV